MVSLHYFRRLCSPGRVMPEARSLSSLFTSINKFVYPESHRRSPNSFLGLSGHPNLVAILFVNHGQCLKVFRVLRYARCSFHSRFFLSHRQVLFRRRSIAAKPGVQPSHRMRCFRFLSRSLALRFPVSF